jgi:hypothetical protein
MHFMRTAQDLLTELNASDESTRIEGRIQVRGATKMNPVMGG